MIIATLGEDISIGASAVTGGSVGGGAVELAVGCGLGVAGAPFILLAFSPFRSDFGVSSLFVSAKLFFWFLLGKHMGNNGRGEVSSGGAKSCLYVLESR
jgi:hypothetical protein